MLAHARKSNLMEREDFKDVAEAGERSLNIDQLADLLGVSTATARRVAGDLSFPNARRFRGCIRWLRSEVVVWLREHAPTMRPGR
jgi:predicted DNA-binding transcriptional regulator AlpA